MVRISLSYIDHSSFSDTQSFVQTLKVLYVEPYLGMTLSLDCGMFSINNSAGLNTHQGIGVFLWLRSALYGSLECSINNLLTVFTVLSVSPLALG